MLYEVTGKLADLMFRFWEEVESDTAEGIFKPELWRQAICLHPELIQDDPVMLAKATTKDVRIMEKETQTIIRLIDNLDGQLPSAENWDLIKNCLEAVPAAQELIKLLDSSYKQQLAVALVILFIDQRRRIFFVRR